MTDKLPKPEFEAEIYYLTVKEGGRKTPVHSGYRGQFHYNDRDWDAPQEFIDKEICNLGESVKVKMQTLSPDYHVGQLTLGQDFEIREGAKTIGKGKITDILRQDLNFWDTLSFLKSHAVDLKPYSGDDLIGFKMDFEAYLIDTGVVEEVDIIETGQQDCMVKVICKIIKDYSTPRFITDKIIDCWKKDLAITNHVYKVQLDTKVIKDRHVIDRFILTFATWNKIYLTGQIIIE